MIQSYEERRKILDSKWEEWRKRRIELTEEREKLNRQNESLFRLFLITWVSMFILVPFIYCLVKFLN